MPINTLTGINHPLPTTHHAQKLQSTHSNNLFTIKYSASQASQPTPQDLSQPQVNPVSNQYKYGLSSPRLGSPLSSSSLRYQFPDRSHLSPLLTNPLAFTARPILNNSLKSPHHSHHLRSPTLFLFFSLSFSPFAPIPSRSILSTTNSLLPNIYSSTTHPRSADTLSRIPHLAVANLCLLHIAV
ncbi:hypothetical protein PGTUg99_001471 [Puccinia graminis f. sp. tritici]|uniref:Uncharacterized protein n=1 Tax=Puccinia graminis f. sp. tritici TaxID=56615 RepID=A0A5B0RB87_PUCGR|nr:hypothetical protein PGTUg99_001471 [Puccinia graminis f. sp. tritici]